MKIKPQPPVPSVASLRAEPPASVPSRTSSPSRPVDVFDRAAVASSAQASGAAPADRLKLATIAGVGADANAGEVRAYSFRDGTYDVVSDLHWGGGASDPNEKFNGAAPEAFVRYVGALAARPGHNTLVLNGDTFDFWRHLGPGASSEEVKQNVTSILVGHAAETKALASAVADGNLRVMYTFGNHDPFLADPKIREHLVSEMCRVGGLDEQQAADFKARVAYTGFAAMLGEKSDAIVLHGNEGADPANSWGSLGNPFGGDRRVDTNFGWMVNELWHKLDLEKNAPGLAEGDLSALAKCGYLLTNPKFAPAVIDLIGSVTAWNGGNDVAHLEAKAADDRAVLNEWASANGLPQETAEQLSKALASMPKPAHERLRSHNPLGNLAALLLGVGKLGDDLKTGQAKMDEALLKNLPGLKCVVSGHTHLEEDFQASGKDGKVRAIGSGTWTGSGRSPRFDVVRMTTDPAGKLSAQGLGRVDAKTGLVDQKPSLQAPDPSMQAHHFESVVP